MRVAKRAEFDGVAREWGHKDRDATEPFFQIRKQIIGSVAPDLSDSELVMLSQQTRGRREGDILKAVEEYRSTGSTNATPDHPTNTSDPFMGNWAERLMDPYWLADLCNSKRMNVNVYPGYLSLDPNSRTPSMRSVHVTGRQTE